MCPGHERWHPNPGFYYLRGGGPMLDMGPYYITDLVNLLGPVASVSGVATRLRERARRSPASRCKGTRIPVEVATHVTGTLMFVDGAAVAIDDELRRAAAQAHRRSKSMARRRR